MSAVQNIKKLNDIYYPVGAVGDGVANDRIAIQAAIDKAHANGGGTVVLPPVPVYYRIRSALLAKSGVTVLVPNNSTRIVDTVDEPGKMTWPTYGIWVYGGYTTANYVRATAHSIAATTEGDPSVTLSTPGDHVNFSIGDVVSVETVSTFTVGSDQIPTWLQVNVVEDINTSTGEITLRRPVFTSQASARIRQLNTNITYLNSNGSDSGNPLSAVRDFSIIGGTWETTDPVVPFMGAGGIIDSVIKPYKVVAGEGTVYGNLFAHCKLGEDVLISSRVACELAFGSHNNFAEIGSISMTGEGNPSRLAGANEGAHDNVFNIGNIDIGKIDPDSVIEIANAYRNKFKIGSITGSVVSGPVVEINRFNFTGTSNDTYDNTVVVGASKISSQLRYIQVASNPDELNTYRNKVVGDFYGSVTNDAISITALENIIEGYCENGVVAISTGSLNNVLKGKLGTGVTKTGDNARLFNNTLRTETASSRVLQSKSYILDSATYTSVSGLSKTTTFPAGTLTTGDVLRFRLRGQVTGSSGTKTLQLAFGGTTFLDLSGGSAIATGTQGVDVEVEIYIASNTVATGQVRRTIGSTTTLTDIGITGLNFATTAYDFVQTISVASVGDTFTARQSRLFCHRPFCDNSMW